MYIYIYKVIDDSHAITTDNHSHLNLSSVANSTEVDILTQLMVVAQWKQWYNVLLPMVIKG